MIAYFGRVWFVLDILLNVLMGGDIETVSSNMGRKLTEQRKCTVCSLVCSVLNWFWPDHCIHNIMTPWNKK